MIDTALIALSAVVLAVSSVLAVYWFRGTPVRRAILWIAVGLIVVGGIRRTWLVYYFLASATLPAHVIRQDVLALLFLTTMLFSGVLFTHFLLLSIEERTAALRQSEARFRGILEHTFAGYFYCNRDGCFEHVNHAMLAMHGYAHADELIGKHVSILQEEEDTEELRRLFSPLLSGKPIPTGELRLRKKTGAIAHHVFSAHPVFDADRVVGFEMLLIDITAIREAEQALHDSEKKYAAIFESSRDALMLLHGDTYRFVAGNQATLNMFRIADEAEFIQLSPAYLSPEYQPDGQSSEIKAKAMIDKAIHEGAHSFEWIHQRRNGEDFIATVLLTRIDMDNDVLVQATVRDITEQRATEQALRQSEQRYNQLAWLNRTITWETDANGLCTYISDVVTDVLGYHPDDVVNTMHCYEFCPESDQEAMKAFSLKILGEKQPYRGQENKAVTKDGRIVWLLSNGMPILDSDGTLLGFRGMDTDITDRKQMEEEKERLQEQFVHTQKIECVGRLAGGVAHDFNNKLGVILGYLELASKHVGNDPALHNCLQKMENAAKSSADLTRQILAFARRQTIAPQQVNINETVTTLLSMLKKVIGEDILLTWEPKSTQPYIKIDPAQVDQILANLLLNARDAIDGVGHITVETADTIIDDAYCAAHSEAIPGDYVVLAVSDDGCGMDKETRASIFEPFFTTKQVGEGTGLGLSTVYGIVKQNNGFVNVYSEPGQGTVLRIYLPRCADVDTAAPFAPTVCDIVGGQETILVVEDESDLLELCTFILKSLGYCTLTADTPEDALRIGEENSGNIQLLITDVVMPSMNGRDLARQLSTSNPTMKVLFMSGYTENAIAHHGVLEEGVFFMQKPFTTTHLADMVRKALHA